MRLYPVPKFTSGFKADTTGSQYFGLRSQNSAADTTVGEEIIIRKYSQTDGNGELTQYITTTPRLLGCKNSFSTSLLASLTMDTLIKKTTHTSRGFTYTYYVSRESAGKPTILLLHGWPDHEQCGKTLQSSISYQLATVSSSLTA